jgi:hypothetical protein
VDELDEDQAKSTWVRAALDDEEVLTEETAKAYVEAKLGAPVDKLAVFCPGDPEANDRAVAAGFQLVRGGHLPSTVWGQVRQSNMIGKSSVLTPSHQQRSGWGSADVEVAYDKLTYAQRFVLHYTQALGRRLLGVQVWTRIVNDGTSEGRKYLATYRNADHRLTLNVRTLGRRWFKDLEDDVFAPRCVETLIHELAHEKVSNHLSDKFHDECCRLGSVFVALVGGDREAFEALVLQAKSDAVNAVGS